MTHRILLVEDDSKLGEQVVKYLERDGFDVTWAQDGNHARLINPVDFEVVILDLMLPGTYGLDILKHYRAKSDVPVLILSAREDSSDKVRALKLGADDYVTKPFWPEELIARVRARLRRPIFSRSGSLSFSGLSIDASAHAARTDEGEVELTRAEFEILHMLVRRAGSAVTRAALVAATLDPDMGGHERTLDVHMSRLRKKLGEVGGCIQTVWGIGYKFVPLTSELTEKEGK